MTTKNNPPLKRSIEGIVLCVSLIALILITEITLQSQTQQQLSQRSYKLSENAFGSTIEYIPANNFDGIITNVIDGDTLDISTNDGNTMTIRLVLVDAPEINELGYSEAKDYVTQNCLDKPATVDPDNNQDLSYGRLVALVYCNGLNINEAIIAAGFAEIYRSFCEESEFGVSEWAQNYGCAADIDVPNGGDVSEHSNINDDDEQEKVSNDCDSAYSDICIPSPPPDLDCGDIPDKNFNVEPPDPHNFDGDSDGIGCES
jgi:micrococcal nuclease